MSSLSLQQLLSLYMWFPLAALLVFLLLIARFYERFSNKQTFFPYYLMVLVLFGGWSVRYASADAVAGNMLGDLLLGGGGLLLMLLTLRLYWLMIWKQRDESQEDG